MEEDEAPRPAEEARAESRKGRAGAKGPPGMLRAIPATSIWIGACLLVFVAQTVFSGHGIFAYENISISKESGLVGSSVRRCLDGGNPLVLPIAPLSHGGLLHLFLGCVGLIAAGQVVERVLGSGYAVATMVLSGAAATAIGWISTGEPSLGASSCYFGYLGAAVSLSLRGAIPRHLLWHSSFPLIVLGGIFAYFAELAVYVTHGGHLGALGVGVALGAAVPRDKDLGLPLRIALLAWLSLGLAFTLISTVRDGEWDFRWEYFHPSHLLRSSRFVGYEDPAGRFRLQHPEILEPSREEGELVFRLTGPGGGPVLRIRGTKKGPFYNLQSLVRTTMLEYRQTLEGEYGPGAFEVKGEEEERLGEAEARRVTVKIRAGERVLMHILIFAETEERFYRVEGSHLEEDSIVGEWIDRMIGSLEVLE